MNELIDVVNGFYARKGENNSAPNAKSTFPQIPKELRSDSEQGNNNDDSGNSNSLSSSQVNENAVEKIVKCIQMRKIEFYENCTFYYYFDSNNKYKYTLADEPPKEYNLSIKKNFKENLLS